MRLYPIRTTPSSWYHAMSLAILVSGLSFTHFSFLVILGQEKLAAQDSFFRVAQIRADEVSQGLAQTLQLVRSADAYITASNPVSRRGVSFIDSPPWTCQPDQEGLKNSFIMNVSRALLSFGLAERTTTLPSRSESQLKSPL